MKRNRIFISYRRDGGVDLASRVYERLRNRGYNVFMDIEDLRSGPFNTALYQKIEHSSDVIVILSKKSLDRCVNDGDWVRLEIAHAIQKGVNIVPVLANGFQFPETLPNDLKKLPNYNGIESSYHYFDASIRRLETLLTARRKNRKNVSNFTRTLIPTALALIACGLGIFAITSFQDKKNIPPEPISPRITPAPSAPVADTKPDTDNRTPSTAPTNVHPKGLVLYMPFNEPPEGATVKDYSGHENHGVLQGAEWVQEGRIGGAYRFKLKDENNRIVVKDSASLDCTSVTIAAWIKTDNVGSGWSRITDKDWEYGYNLTMGGTMPDGAIRWHGKAMMEASGKGWVATKERIADGHWHHLVGSYENGAMRIYIDGKISSRRNPPEAKGPLLINEFDLSIGNCRPGYKEEGVDQPYAFDGLIDEVYIFNRALTESEAIELFKGE